jgi:hypothetical protein
MAAKKKEAKTQAEPTSAPGYVTVFANLHNDHEFNLPDGSVLTIKGYPVSKLVGTDGRALPAGQYGETYGVKAEDWEAIQATYGDMDMFKNGLVFAEDDLAFGQARADEQQELRHGLEQADPLAGATKPLDNPEA